MTDFLKITVSLQSRLLVLNEFWCTWTSTEKGIEALILDKVTRKLMAKDVGEISAVVKDSEVDMFRQCRYGTDPEASLLMVLSQSTTEEIFNLL